MNWRIGQKVVCVKTHSQGAVTSGNTYSITGLYDSCHGSGIWVTVGVNDPFIAQTPIGGFFRCSTCNMRQRKTTHEWMLRAELFRPLAEADLSAELAETFLKGQPPSEQEVFNPQYA